PSLIGARDNPDDAKLADVVPPALYSRWAPLKERYFGRDRAIEKRRPIFAAEELFAKAVDRATLSRESVVEPVVRSAAKRAKATITQPQLKLEFDQPRAAIKEFKRSQLDDVECFERTLER